MKMVGQRENFFKKYIQKNMNSMKFGICWQVSITESMLNSQPCLLDKGLPRVLMTEVKAAEVRNIQEHKTAYKVSLAFSLWLPCISSSALKQPSYFRMWKVVL